LKIIGVVKLIAIITMLISTGHFGGNVMEMEPSRAVYYSLIFPGLGQFYVGHPVKGAVFSAAGMYFGYKATKALYESGGDPDSPAFSTFMDNMLSFVGIWGFAVLDAYISGHLYGFDGEMKRVIDVEVRPGGVALGVAIRN